VHPLGAESRKIETILVGTEGHVDDEQGLTILCGTLDPASVRLRIVHVLVVPSQVPLEVSMPVAEGHATRILEKARELAGRFDIRAQTTILRGRAVGECLVEEARQQAVDAICIRFRSRPVPWGHRLVSETVSTVLSAAPCPVIILHLPHHHGSASTARLSADA
jgi:nucleotide-binding universal stress UspA family protein